MEKIVEKIVEKVKNNVKIRVLRDKNMKKEKSDIDILEKRIRKNAKEQIKVQNIIKMYDILDKKSIDYYTRVFDNLVEKQRENVEYLKMLLHSNRE